ncbi:MAG: hypothetical protein ACI4A3_02395 [Lachnospiraceae bacterium]
MDDRQVNVDAAIQAGMQAVLFDGEDKLRKYMDIAEW